MFTHDERLDIYDYLQALCAAPWKPSTLQPPICHRAATVVKTPIVCIFIYIIHLSLNHAGGRTAKDNFKNIFFANYMLEMLSEFTLDITHWGLIHDKSVNI